jgi:hypothetical protein
MTTSLSIPLETGDVVGDTLVPSIGSFNVIYSSQVADILVRSPLNDIPHYLPVVVDIPHLASSLMPLYL